MRVAYIDELLCSGRTGGFAYDNKYHIRVEPVGFPSKMIYTLVEPVGLPNLKKYHIVVECGVYHLMTEY